MNETTMPAIDRNALDEALAVHVHKNTGQAPHHPQTGWAPNYCGSLDAAVTALNALGLGWQRFYADGWHLAVGARDVLAGPWLDSLYPDDLAAPAALATALVLGALAVLENTEEDH